MMRLLRLFLVAALLAPSLLAGQSQSGRLVSLSRSADDPVRDAAIEKLTDFLNKYPDSPLRPNALYQLGELLIRRADDEFAAAQRATPTGTDSASRADVPVRPDYSAAMPRYEELIRRYPDFQQIDAAAYTLGTIYFGSQRYADAVRVFEIVTTKDTSRFRAESFFRLGDSYFELAAKERGNPRREIFAKAAAAYDNATKFAPPSGDIYFLSLYKLGWSYYNQANQTNQEEYRKAVEVFGQLVAAYDKLSAEQQSRLGLQSEAIEYMAIAFTQVGGAQAANQFFASRGESNFKLPVLRRVAQSLRDQGDFVRAVEAYQLVIAEAPNDSAALGIQREIIDIYQNRLQDAELAQQARLELVTKFGPGSTWASANPGLVADVTTKAREEALRQSGQFRLSQAQKKNDKAAYAEAAQLYGRFIQEFAGSDSAQAVNLLYAQALFGQGDYMRAGSEYARTAYAYQKDPVLAAEAGQSAIVAFDSALARNKSDAAAQDSLFSAVDRFVTAFGDNEAAKKGLILKGKRASENQRWDVMAATFRTYAEKYPNDPYTPTAQKLVGDALYKAGQYAEAQAQWETAQTVAASSGRRALADTISRIRTGAAATFADTLVKQGDYRRAAEEIYVAFAEKNPNSDKAPEALRNAIETYMLADSAARAKGDDAASRQARERAIELSQRLVSQYPQYKFRLQYQTLQAQLLADVGRRDEAVEALRALVRDNPSWPERADAMVRLAVTLDSLDKKTEAAEAYAQFAAAFPKDKRAADAQFNAAVTYAEAGDTASASRAYGTFASRFPRDPRASEARRIRLSFLQASGDSVTANRELASLCVRPTEDLKALCSSRVAESYFRRGVALFPAYKNIRLVISSPKQLTRAGVERASARKQQALRTMSAHFTNAIKTGNPEWLAASTYYIGLAQWEYGDFLRNVQLPESLTPEEREAGQKGAAGQADQHYDAAKKTWQSLLDKAEQEQAEFGAEARVWVDRARDALAGNVPEAPPTSFRERAGLVATGGLD